MKVDRLPFDPGPPAWDKILPPAQAYPSLEEKKTADWLIIGGGFAGLSAARRLQQLHPKDTVIVVEARGIAEGPAGRNSGFMIDLPHNLGSSDYAGALNEDRMQTEMNRHAINFAKETALEFGFPQEAIVVSGKVNAAASEKGMRHNLDYSKHLKTLGEDFELLDEKQMHSICGSKYYKQGLFTPGTAMLQPAMYIRELAGAFAKSGGMIFENSAVTNLEKRTSDWQASSQRGAVTAGKVILAVNGHAESFGLFKRRLMHIYLYASMTRPLGETEVSQLGGEQNWAFTPADPLGTTVRKISGTGGTRIVVRNRFTWSPSRTVNETKMRSIAKIHDRSFKARFPMLGNMEMAYRWGGLLCLSLNNVSAFGEVEENLFSACCQNGLGTAKGTMSGILAAEQASNINSGFLDHMLAAAQPKKLPPEPFSSIGANAYMRWGEYKAGAEL